MLDSSCKSFTFEEISEELSHEYVYSKYDILDRLLSDFWRDKFNYRNLGWNETRARRVLGLQDLYNVDESSPCPSRSVSEKDDCARPRDFRLMSREIAFDLLLAVEDPLAFSFGDESDPDFYDLLYDFLAKNGLRPLDPGGQAVLENIALTKDELCRWCQRCGEKLPQSFEQAPPQKRQQASSEAQTAQGSGPPEGPSSLWPDPLEIPRRATTIAAETRCKDWLAGLMRQEERPSKTKSGYRTEAKKQFSVGSRAFDRAWRNACVETGNSAWSRPGRKS